MLANKQKQKYLTRNILYKEKLFNLKPGKHNSNLCKLIQIF